MKGYDPSDIARMPDNLTKRRLLAALVKDEREHPKPSLAVALANEAMRGSVVGRKRATAHGEVWESVGGCPDAPDAAEGLAGAKNSHVYILPYPPVTNKLWREFIDSKGRARRALSKAGNQYKQDVANSMYDQPFETAFGDVALTIRFYRRRRVGDVDGPVKSLLDALGGILYVDDRQVVELHLYRHDDKLNARCEVEVVET